MGATGGEKVKVRSKGIDFFAYATVLLVDDSVSVTALIREGLKGIVSEVRVAGTGKEAIAQLMSEPATLVLLDHRLPDMTGIEVIKSLARQGIKVPFVTITGHGDEKVAVEMMKLGAHDYLIKDENFLDLLPSVIRQVLGHLETEARLKITEEDLAAEEKRYQELFDRMGSGVAVLSMKDGGEEFIISDFNRAAARISGLGRHEVIGRNLLEILPSSGESGLVSAMQQVWETGEPAFIPAAFYRDQGISGWRECNLYRLPAGEVVVIFDDVTARKKCENDLLESEQRFRSLSREFQTLLDGIPDALSLLSPDLKIVWSNKGHLELFENGATDRGRHCYEVVRQRNEPCEDCPVVKSFQTGEPQEVLRKFGGKTFGVKIFPLRDEGGKVVNVINMSSDVTEKIRLRDEAARSGRLASLGELAAGIAHEINNPNALILLNAPVLMEIWNEVAPLLEKRSEFPLGKLKYSRVRNEIPRLHSEVIDAAHRIKVIVEDLKEFVSQEESQSPEDLDLNEVVRKAVRLVRNTIKNSTSHFQVSYENEMPIIRGVFGRLEQVVVNLLLNACQALPKTECGIYVSTLFDDRRNKAVLEIRDEGVGIAPEDLSRLTDPFYTTRRQRGGTGLGLSVSARIVKEHDGILDFSSETGKGTVATLTLPVSCKA
jgi:PAS domain S-box-containing protein